MKLSNIILTTALLSGCAAPPVVTPQNLFSNEQKFNQFKTTYMKMLPEKEAKVICQVYDLFLPRYTQKDSYCLIVHGFTIPDKKENYVVSAVLPTKGNPQRTLVNHLTIQVYSKEGKILLEGRDKGITGKNDANETYSTFKQMNEREFDFYLGRIAKILEESQKYRNGD